MSGFSGFSIPAVASEDKKIIETGAMKRAMHETQRALERRSGCLWSGAAGVGKTEAAKWLKRGLKRERRNGDKDVAQAAYWEAPCGHDAPREARQLMGYLYRAITGAELDAGVVRGRTIDYVEGLVQRAARQRRVRLLLIDEAQALTSDALKALVRFVNRTRETDWSITPVLIATGDMPDVIISTPFLARRFDVRVPLEPVRKEEVELYVKTLFPAWFPESIPKAFLDYLLKQTGGNLSELHTLLKDAEAIVSGVRVTPDVTALKAAQLRRRQATAQMRRIQRSGYVPEGLNAKETP